MQTTSYYYHVLNFESLFPPPPPPVYRNVKDKDYPVIIEAIFSMCTQDVLSASCNKIVVDDRMLITALAAYELCCFFPQE
jgi:hypothetical protein